MNDERRCHELQDRFEHGVEDAWHEAISSQARTGLSAKQTLAVTAAAMAFTKTRTSRKRS